MSRHSKPNTPDSDVPDGELPATDPTAASSEFGSRAEARAAAKAAAKSSTSSGGPNQTVIMVNAGVRFILELATLAALAVWGAHTSDGGIGRILLALGGPLIAAVLWSLFVSPQRTVDAGLPVRIAVEVVVLGAAAVALFALGAPVIGALFVVVALVSGFITHRWPMASTVRNTDAEPQDEAEPPAEAEPGASDTF